MARDIGLMDYGRFLIGNEESIRKVSSGNGVLEIGALMVVSAGVARTAWLEVSISEFLFNLLTPFLASIASASILYVFISRASKRRSGGSAKLPFLSYLGLYWWTAPLAWLYGLPIELVFEATAAVTMNLVLLLIVSIWRVAFIVRVLSVLGNWSGLQAFLIVFRGLMAIMLPLSMFGSLLILVVVGMAGNPQPGTDNYLYLVIYKTFQVAVPFLLLVSHIFYRRHILPTPIKTGGGQIVLGEQETEPGISLYAATILALGIFFTTIAWNI